MSKLIIPVFITHQGCPHRCSFCNQIPVTGKDEQQSHTIGASDVAEEVRAWLNHSVLHQETEVAFYGGSFTGLANDKQAELLKAVQPFIENGQVDSIRLSTRPDYINQETPGFLKQYHVKTVEIGVQSLNQKVLDANFRGHTTGDIKSAIIILKDAGFRVGAQILLGLPEETTVSAIKSVRLLSRMAPHFVRLYPALVLKGSALEQLYQKGQYKPMSLNKAIALCSRIKSILEESNIPVIRTGLQPSEELAANVLAGPYHPALGEMVLSRSIFKKIRHTLAANKEIRQINTSMRDQSIIFGQKKSNIKRLQSLGLLKNIQFNFIRDMPRGVLDFV